MAGSLANPWTFDRPGVLEALRDAAVVDLQLVYDSSNYVFLARLEHPEHGAGLGIYKPARGERPLSDFPYGTLHHREVAAWELSELLGWRLVPPTVERDGPQGTGSMQLVIDHRPSEHYFVTRERAELEDQFIRVAVFDLVANNADRKGGHLLLDAAEHVWCIDNGLCFHSHEKLRTVVWDFAGTEIPEPLLDDLRRVRGCVEAGEDAVAALTTRMTERERLALLARIDQLIAHPVLPEMYPWRCTPWPLV
ncbi:MAG: hypothetical protein R3C39_05565 [Dehalococcoidia bacterium]